MVARCVTTTLIRFDGGMPLEACSRSRKFRNALLARLATSTADSGVGPYAFSDISGSAVLEPGDWTTIGSTNSPGRLFFMIAAWTPSLLASSAYSAARPE